MIRTIMGGIVFVMMGLSLNGCCIWGPWHHEEGEHGRDGVYRDGEHHGGGEHDREGEHGRGERREQ